MLRAYMISAAAAALLATPALAQDAQPAQAAAPAAAAAQPQQTASTNTVVDVLRSAGQFNTLLTALDQAQLTETLTSRPAITVLAPTDAAFAALPEAERTRLLDPANAQELRELLLYHVIVADVSTSQIQGAAGPVETAGGDQVQIDGSGESIKVDNATVVQAELDASNGAVYGLDQVLNPAQSRAAMGDSETALNDSAAQPPAEAPAATDATPAATTTTERPAQPGETAPDGEQATTMTTTQSPTVPNPTDGQQDDATTPEA